MNDSGFPHWCEATATWSYQDEFRWAQNPEDLDLWGRDLGVGACVHLHSKKQIVLPNPQKRFRRCLKVSNGVESLKKRIKISTKPLKVLPVYRSQEPSPAKPFFKFRTADKGFVDIFILFLRLSTPLDTFRHLRNLFWWFGKTPIFLVLSSTLT